MYVDIAEQLFFLDWIEDWARQWGERDCYYIRHDDLIYAITHGLCEVLVLNKTIFIGPEQYVFYRNIIKVKDRIFINTDMRRAGH